ncbi:alpha/beta fold hydrolase [Natronobacterium gregoryi]|uniref:Alpha/beta hydrolase n=2 Tax=Natronobacterium gregoryi TaxID=44930 RepID=L0AID7_NATGS|nr:alpha/beta hydrolase [Natronobacterium gregoryi]AFZ72835.1 putative hydrolase or acyltransferase of alpha/beta superfamily [Natronobacterium gregoryi SP2]ELY69401.1 alpha/beta hydrolase [Natronobacterium gregoryi SP2]PLK21173.1 alpha/beta hydrolase [Natronobacterium gregoryi SP2]SFJ09610.1 Pimeloyl-ACP methyl ester carboxylesterase [Natronobacterium gregoryi]
MPTATNGDVSLFYERDGEGETVVFVPEAGLGGWSWGWQHAALAGPFEAVAWDLRGTGRSDAPPGPYDLETLADDLEAVLSNCNARNAHVVGLGLGGAIALEAARTSSCVETLTLIGTAARESAFDLEGLFAPPDSRSALRESLETVLSAAFRETQPDVVDGIVDWRADGDANRAGWEAQVGALEGFDATDWLVEVTQPTRLFHGADDTLVPVSAGQDLARRLPRGECVELEGAGHLVTIERSRTVNDRLRGFLEEHSAE